jgi:hypothetical protein
MVTSIPQGFIEPGSAQSVGLGRITARKSKAWSQKIPCSIPSLKERPFRHTQHHSNMRFFHPQCPGCHLFTSEVEECGTFEDKLTFQPLHLGVQTQPWKRVPFEKFVPDD